MLHILIDKAKETLAPYIAHGSTFATGGTLKPFNHDKLQTQKQKIVLNQFKVYQKHLSDDTVLSKGKCNK